MNELIQKLERAVGANSVRADKESLAVYGVDWTKGYAGSPTVVVFPSSTEDVVAIVKLAQAFKVPIVPSGGRTGLSAAAVAQNGEIVLSMERMDQIIEIDQVGKTMTVEAGVITEKVQQVAADNDLFFAVDLAAKGSSQIGGNIATNAGGLKFIRYGGTREQVLGVEAVLADGQILDVNYALPKNNIGYDLRHLLVGSEGTLGIITKATLKLWSKPRDLNVLLIGVESFEEIPVLLKAANQRRITLMAFEYFDNTCLDLVLKNNPNIRKPFGQTCCYYLLMEYESFAEQREQVEELIAEMSERANFVDALLATTSKESKEFWQLRELISESIAINRCVKKNDISIPISRLTEFVLDLEKQIQLAPKTISMASFGHIGDGNIHLNYFNEGSISDHDFAQSLTSVENAIMKKLKALRGSISAEHGIGLTKKKMLENFIGSAHMSLLKGIKKELDPNNLLNPQKIFD
jgi:FAD/FMN-containing dehydrogenase